MQLRAILLATLPLAAGGRSRRTTKASARSTDELRARFERLFAAH